MTDGGDPRVVLQLEIDGGFAAIPGLARSASVDTLDLDAERAGQVRAAVDHAEFFSRPERLEDRAAGADQRTYTVTVTQDGRSHTVQRQDPVQEPEVAALIRLVESLAPA